MAPWDGVVVNLAPGFYFHPTESDLVGYYLHHKALRKAFMYEDLVPEFNLYGSAEPWVVWKRFGGESIEKGEDLYFFTTLKTTSAAASRVSRKAGSGCWHGEGKATDVPDPKNKNAVLGSSKRFHYKNPKSNQNRGWIMIEYSLKDYPSRNNDDDDGQLVLCRLRKSDRKRKFDDTAAAATEDFDDCDKTLQPKRKIPRKTETNTGLSEVIEVNYDHRHDQQQELTCIGENNFVTPDVSIGQPQLDFVTAAANPNMVSSSSARPDEFVFDLDDLIDQPAAYLNYVPSQFEGVDDSALVTDYSFAHDNDIGISGSFTPPPLVVSPEAANEEGISDSYSATATTQGLTDNTIGIGITGDQTGGEFGIRNADLYRHDCQNFKDTLDISVDDYYQFDDEDVLY